MENQTKQYILGGLAIAAICAGFAALSFSYFEQNSQVSERATTTVSTAVPANPTSSVASAPPKTAETRVVPSAVPTKDTSLTAISASNTVSIPVIAGKTVLDAMYADQARGGIAFSGREYVSLGFFVESINGKENADGRYWFLYLNGKSSDTGASQTTLKEGDVVEWRYEKSH